MTKLPSPLELDNIDKLGRDRGLHEEYVRALKDVIGLFREHQSNSFELWSEQLAAKEHNQQKINFYADKYFEAQYYADIIYNLLEQ